LGDVVSFDEYRSRKIRLERVALNEALLRQAWERADEREAARRYQQLRWRSRRRRRTR
jgi:hypothetical protein